MERKRGLGSTAYYKIERDVKRSGDTSVIPRWHISQCQSYVKVTQSQSVTFCKEGFYSDKGKAIPLQAWTGPEGSRSLKLPDFKTIGT